ncbi:MFS general substrate transporter [Apiospora phragmitis]|uniref:MFS general substrate transporter n=1 Tax=Apiospora phragmitis TaxID=2905665 RepID=A0ABR1T463_9PEZI
MSTQTVTANELQPIPMVELEQQQHEYHHGGDLGDSQVATSPAMTPADTGPASMQHAVVNRATAAPYFKLLVAGFSFFCAGVNDGTLGPLIPYIIDTFRIGTGEVAFIYVSTFAGWFLAAATGPLFTAHLKLGQLLTLGAALQLLAQCLRMPWGGGGSSLFPLFCATFFVQALGMAYQDSHANTFVSGLPNVPHRWLGFIHACYALGCLVGPLIATGLATSTTSTSKTSPSATTTATTAGVEGWRRVYFILIGIGVLNMAGVALAFRDSLWSSSTSRLLRTYHPSNNNTPPAATDSEQQHQPQKRRKTRAAFRELATLVLHSHPLWLLSLFYFFHFGALLTAGGWVVAFLTTARGGALSAMGYVPTGLYGGLLLGRLLLAEPTFRLGERPMLLAYSAACVALQLVFWLQPSVVASAAALGLMGFFSGPFFATGMSVASQLFPKKSQSAALGFIFVLAQAGGAIFPSITGLVATSAGVAVLQPIVLALIAASAFCWYLVPRVVSPHEE